MNRKWLLLLPFLFLPFMGHAQVVGPGFVDYVTSAPSGSCSSNAHQRNVMGLGTVYTCQSGTWAQISGGGGGSCTASFICPNPSIDQTITGAHALILSDPASTFWEKNAIGAGNTSAPGSTSSFFVPVFPTILDAENTLTALPASTAASSVLATYLNNTADMGSLYANAWSELSTLGSSSANFTSDLIAHYVELDHNGGGTVNAATAVHGEVDLDGAGVISTGSGVDGEANNFGSGTFVTANGVESFVSIFSTGNITNAAGFRANGPSFSGAGTMSHVYGLYIADQTVGGGQNPDPWGIFNEGGKNDLGPQTTKLGSLLTSTNCADQHAPAVCGSAAAGAVAVPTGVNPTLVIQTTRVTATSRIFLGIDETLTIPSTTCNTTLSTLVQPVVTARTAATSFTIQIGATLAANPACVSYWIVN